MIFYCQKKSKKCQKGFSLMETLVGLAIFLLIAVSVYEGYIKILDIVCLSRYKITATALANEQMEVIRNLPYSDVGILGGLPAGKIQREQTFTRNGREYQVVAVIRNIDDPFDGTIGGAPNDTSPADYKLVDLEIDCLLCKNFSPLSFATTIAPRGLETAATNGALLVRVLDAVGQPVAGANAHIENNLAVPAFTIDDVTNNDGVLQIVDAPPGAEAYEISVSKSGYSSERTYVRGAPENPNPTKPHATVALGAVSSMSFAIDKTSTLDFSTVTKSCSPVGGVDFLMQGSKLIGTGPDVFKYSQSHATDEAGKRVLSGLEWDGYNLTLTDAVYELIGVMPLLPLALNPDAVLDVKLVVAPKNPRSFLATVKDASTRLPLSDAVVTLQKTGYENSLETGRGFLGQTDWSGGSGQEDFIDTQRFLNSDGNIEISDPEGELRLKRNFGIYEQAGYLVSSAFDTGSASNFHQILWLPQDQPPETGPDSAKFQIATNNDKETWNFLGPDGAANTFYTLADANINSVHNGDRYFRYKLFLRTDDVSWTPDVAEVNVTFTSSCVPPGQVIFNGLGSGTYTLTVSKSGYSTFSDSVDISASWQEREVVLSP